MEPTHTQPNSMANIVLDTNSLIMAISERNIYHKIWLSFLAGDYCLCF